MEWDTQETHENGKEKLHRRMGNRRKHMNIGIIGEKRIMGNTKTQEYGITRKTREQETQTNRTTKTNQKNTAEQNKKITGELEA